MNKTLINNRIEGLLLGTAVGDSIGLPREGLSLKRAKRLFGDSPLRHRFFFGKGMISDDTEHACMVAQALLASKGDADRFRLASSILASRDSCRNWSGNP